MVTNNFDAIESFYKIISILLPVGFVIFTIPIALQFTRIFLGDKKTTKTKEIIDFEKIKITSKITNLVEFQFNVQYLKKENPIKSFFYVLPNDDYIKVGKNVYKKDFRQYTFSTSSEVFEKIKEKIQEPISKIKDDSILIQFHDAIHYSLANLSQFCSMQDVVNMEEEVDKVGNLIHEIKFFADEINNSANEKIQRLRSASMNEILSKHHIAMEQLTLQVKLFNSNGTTIQKNNETESASANIQTKE